MSTVFSHSTRAMEADGGRRLLWGVCLAAALLGMSGAWSLFARVTVYAATDRARLEVDRAVHPVEAPVDGRVVATHLTLGREVQIGEMLVELEAEVQRLQREEERTRLATLTPQIEALRAWRAP
jgi:multidrug resistance efflux pump